MFNLINTRADLDAIQGAPEHVMFMACLRGTMLRQVDVAVYPEGYDHDLQPGDQGYTEPDWRTVEDLSVIERFGFSREELLGDG